MQRENIIVQYDSERYLSFKAYGRSTLYEPHLLLVKASQINVHADIKTLSYTIYIFVEHANSAFFTAVITYLYVKISKISRKINFLQFLRTFRRRLYNNADF